ncbi:MAG: DNA polymerase (family X) [Candidatus Peregrinibacteria bacterium Greene0416_19]|nr:MAG: DNA polymerase (family X) [Candidatus Peregrinibacteria bacterium Greene0416_19]
MERNKRLAQLLRQIAALLDEQGVAFKPAAYRRAAQVIEDLPKDIAEYGDAKALMELPGIGEAIAAKTREFIETGNVSFLEKLLREQGGIPPALMEVENLGPKRAREFVRELGIQTIDDLIKAAEAGRLRGLPRMSELMEKKILESARRVTERSRRFPFAEVKPDVEKIIATIRQVPGVERAEVAGSYRREKATVGDIDILAITKTPDTVAEAIATLPIVRVVVAKGGTKISFDLQSGLRVDVRLVAKDQWGSALLYFTGDKEHNIWLRKKAIERGWKLNEYGLFEGGKVIASREETDMYEALGLAWIEPQRRLGAIGSSRLEPRTESS